MHPISGEAMFFDSKLPDDMQQVIEKWEHFTKNRSS
jgi:hypothetical protein